MAQGVTRECPSCLVTTSEATCTKCHVPTLARGVERDPYLGALFAEKFRIEKRIGRGAMSTVYRAHQLAMDRPVALKILKGTPGSDDFGVRRFYRELRATARVEHPNTIRVYDFGHTARGELYLAVELLHGRSLFDELTAVGPMETARVVRIGTQVAKALGAAHQAGVVHRDLKPENLFLVDVFGEPDFVKVLDFGIARVLEPAQGDDAARATFGAVVGTPLYMSPEHVNGGVDARSDLYSLGVVLFTMVVGHEPFRDKDPMRILIQHMSEQPPAPSTLAPRPVPAALDALILGLLQKDPAARPQSADEVIAALQGVGAGAAAAVAPAPKARRRVTGESATAQAVLAQIAAAQGPDERTRPLPLAWDTTVEPAAPPSEDMARTQLLVASEADGPSLQLRRTAELRPLPVRRRVPWRWVAVVLGALVVAVVVALSAKSLGRAAPAAAGDVAGEGASASDAVPSPTEPPTAGAAPTVSPGAGAGAPLSR